LRYTLSARSPDQDLGGASTPEYAWEFEKKGHEVNVRVEGQLVFNTSTQTVTAALAGFGLAYVPEAVK